MGKKRASPYSGIQRQKRAIQQGRGQGHGVAYRPFIQVRRFDFTSHGRSHIWRDPLRPKDEHHLLSDLERYVFLQAMAAGASVRTQFPLCTSGIESEFSHCATEAGTIGIAASLGIKHSLHSKTMLRTMTTDLLLNFPSGAVIAIYVKYQEELSLSTPRAKELLALEREYWRRRNADFIVVTEKHVKTAEVIRWLDWAHSFRIQDIRNDCVISHESLAQFIHSLLRTDPRLKMRDRIQSLGLGEGDGTTILKYCLWKGLIKVDYRLLPRPDLSEPWRIVCGTHKRAPSLVVLPVLRKAMQRETMSPIEVTLAPNENEV